MRSVLLAVALLGCTSSPPPAAPTPPAPDCSAVVAVAQRIAPPDHVEEVKAMVALHCVEDHWSVAATSCIGKVSDADAAHACMRQHLTVEQHDRLMHALEHGGPPPPAAAELRVTAIEPALGDADGGTYVRITGAGFLTTQRNAKVYFGARQGTVVRFTSDRELIVEAPGGKPGEVVDVLAIFSPGGEVKLPQAFTYVEKVATPQPVPPSGPQAAIAVKLNEEGKTLMMKAKYPAASAKFRDAVARVPEPKYFLNLCLSLFQEGKFGEAKTACHAGTMVDPDTQTREKLQRAIDRILSEAKAQNIDLSGF